MVDPSSTHRHDPQHLGPTPIPTRYAGCHFRSRLEARWAVFFDHLGIGWEYEPEGFPLDSGWYLPDFRITLSHLMAWFEVKPTDKSQYDPRWPELANYTLMRVFVAHDIPRPDSDPIFPGKDRGIEVYFEPFEDGFQGADEYYAFCVCSLCDVVGIEFNGLGNRVCSDNACHPRELYGQEDVYTGRDPAIIEAYVAARSARFEHGQAGAT